MSDSVQSTLLPEIYGCADQPANWRGVLDQICRHTKVRSAVIQMLRCDKNMLYPEWEVRDSFSSEHAALHDRYVNNSRNPRLNRKIAGESPAAEAIMRDEERFKPGCPHLARLRERLAMIGMGRSIAIALRMPRNRRLTLLLHRAYGDGREFGTRDEQFLWELTPHLRKSVSLFEKLDELQAGANVMEEIAHRMNTGILVVGCDGRLEWRNRCAEMIIRRSRHLAITGGKLRCARLEDQRRISRLLRAVGMSKPLHERLITTIGATQHDPIQALAMPIPISARPFDSAGSRAARIALLLCEPDHEVALPPSDIGALFGLTPAEAALAAALGEGLTLHEYAERHGITVGTARIQLKSIFSKTGAGRQPELVRLLCASLPARTLI